MNQETQSLGQTQNVPGKKKWQITATTFFLFLAAITLSGCSKTNNNVFQAPAEESKNVAQQDPVKQKEVSLEETYKKIGMECNGPDFQATCSWNGVAFTVSKPSNWDKDVQLRNKACDDGFINPQYLLVSDNKSWHISTDHNEDAVKLSEAFNKEGLNSQPIRYCY